MQRLTIFGRSFNESGYQSRHEEKSLLALAQQQERGLAFSRATRLRQLRVNHQTVAILHQHMALVNQFGFAALPLLKQSQVTVSGRLMRFIRAFLAVKVNRRIAGIVRQAGMYFR
jgi:hypothetical protein